MLIGSIKEDIALEKRISVTPETAKNIIGLGLKVCIEKNYANHLGIEDNEYKKAGVEIKNSSSEVLNSSNLIIKVNCPSENEISLLKEKTILIGMLNPSKNKVQIDKIIKKKIKTFSQYQLLLKNQIKVKHLQICQLLEDIYLTQKFFNFSNLEKKVLEMKFN